MQNRVPVPRSERPALPEFAPVPRQRNRHDGWTPARQKAFIEALADTGSVRRAAGMVNMAQANAYALRRAAGAEDFRRAWEVALDFGLQRLKDEAFERAMEGELIPVFSHGKLMGFRRKRNDALLMFCLRHYGQDSAGKRTTINYFSTRASAAAGSGADGEGAAAAQAQTTLRTVVTGSGGGEAPALRDDRLAAALQGFAGVTLDAQAEAAVAQAIADCAARQAAFDAAMEEGGEEAADWISGDPREPFVRLPHEGTPFRGTLEPVGMEDYVDLWVEPRDADGDADAEEDGGSEAGGGGTGGG